MGLYDWALSAPIGAKVVYHTGQLGTLRTRQIEDGETASREGLVFLAHRSLGNGQYAYEATRIDRQTAIRLGLVGRPGGGVLAGVRLPRLTHPMVAA